MRTNATVIFVAVYAVTHLFMAFALASSQQSGDVHLYYRFAVDTLHSALVFAPFSGGFAIEYPPLTALFVTLPLFPAKLFTGGIEFGDWLLWFKILYLCIDFLSLGLVFKVLAKLNLTKRDYWASLISLYVVSLLLMTLYFDRLDLLLGVLIFFAVLSVHKHPVLPWFWLSVGVCFKVIPVLLAPIFLLFFIAKKVALAKSNVLFPVVIRECSFAIAWSMGLCVLLIAPFYLLWGNDLFAFLSYHSERGVQLESIYSNVIMLAHHLFGVAAEVRFNFGSFNIVSAWSEGLLAISSWLLLLALAGSYLLVAITLWRDVKSEAFSQPDFQLRRLAQLVCLLLIAAILCAKVFSPQYLLWLFPMTVLVGFRTRSAWLFQGSWVSATVLTTLIYPVTYGHEFAQDALAFRRDGQTWWPAPTQLATLLLTLRHLALILALAALIRLTQKKPG